MYRVFLMFHHRNHLFLSLLEIKLLYLVIKIVKILIKNNKKMSAIETVRSFELFYVTQHTFFFFF